MIVEHIFAKQLTRDINGVVKAEEIDNKSAYIELDEYVVTGELTRHMRSFFETYAPAISGQSSAVSGKTGVWISGFFGSGKSHFLKMLSYLLENRKVEKDGIEKQALEFFKDKISDATLYADICSSTTKPIDVILFNIDIRGNSDDGDTAVLKVFLKMFNAQVGYSADYPHIAHMERELEKRGQLLTFQQKFKDQTGSDWIQERDSYDFYRDEMVAAFSEATGQSPESARQSVDQWEQKFPLDINNLAKWIKEYLDMHEGRNLLFLVDEVGQFIGKNTNMMLQLQSITETLGVVCSGRAWVIVTAQADIDAAIGQLSSSGAQDFSKIQGRFYTRLPLSSSNTNEVIQRRLLEKTEPAREELSTLYAENNDILRNQLSFDKTTTATLSSYDDSISFIDNYPFIPYHYQLVQKVFESIRAKGATGKHLAMGERSLLDAFQSAAKQVKDQPTGVLIPFYCFYAPIDSFLEPAVKRTIDQAEEKATLSEFDNNILKTLFLIRYVDIVKSTIDNLVTLSINHIDADKIALKKAIEESLIRLERELLIARNGDEYLFLTNEEKEIENEIRHTDIEPSEITNSLSTLIFTQILKNQTSYRYPVNKQDFRLSRFCNGHPKDGTTLEDLVLKLTSPLDPNYDQLNEAQCISQSLDVAGGILFKLGDDKKLWDELTTFIKTARFLRINAGQRPDQEQLLREKAVENSAREKRLELGFQEMFRDAAVYAIGQRMNLKGSTPQSMVDEVCRYIIDNTFHKLSLLRPFTGEMKRELMAVLTADDAAQLGLDLGHQDYCPDAVREVEQYIVLKIENNNPVYLKDLLHRFSHSPYGWHDDDIILLLARIALAGKITFSHQGNDVVLKTAFDLFMNVRKRGEIRLQRVRQHDEQQLRRAGKVIKELFNKTFTGQTEKELAEMIRSELRLWQNQLQSFERQGQAGQLPGRAEIATGLLLVAGILEQSTYYGLIQRFVEEEKKLVDFSEDYENLDDFYNSQISIWKQLGTALKAFQPNEHMLNRNAEAKNALQQLFSIHESEAPYARLNRVDGLIGVVRQENQLVLEKRRSEVLTEISELISSLQEQLVALPQKLSNQALYPLQQCKKRVEATDSIHQLNSELQEASQQEDEAIEILNRYAEEQNKKLQEQQSDSAQTVATDQGGEVTYPEQTVPVPPAPKQSRRIVVVSPAELLSQTGGAKYLEDEAGVEEYLAQLRKKLVEVVASGDRVRIK
ncbi:MAG: BREX system P-loop protein BrxC [Gimesia sp.]